MYCQIMGKPNRTLKRGTLYLEPEKFEMLVTLAKTTRIPRAELEREAINDLLVKYKVLKVPKGGKQPA
jgi:Ribbon-helix-helix domain